MTAPLIVLGVGDVGACRPDPDSMFAPTATLLRGGDIAFGQLETTISARGEIVPNARLAMRAPPALAPALARAGFATMSFAGNHCLDWGYTAFADTLAHAADAGIALCGAGATLAEACRPAIVSAGDRTVAFLAANSILPEGYAAGEARAGCSPLRAHTVYEQIEHDQPHTPARIVTYTDRADLDALCAAVRTARAATDHVIVSLHWGIHMSEAVLADYQTEAAHALIDAGADAILGHHPHILKGVEIRRGKPIFYSLGNFAIEQPHVWDPAIVDTPSFRHLMSLNPSADPRAAYMLPPDSRMTGIAKLILRDAAIEARFVPAWIGEDSVPVPLAPDDPRFEQVRAYLARVSTTAGLSTRFATAGDEILVEG